VLVASLINRHQKWTQIELTWLRDILIVLVLILRNLLPLALFTFLELRFGGAKFFIEQIIRVDLGRLLRCAYIAFGVGSLRV
jgi:hypothetical protein